MTFLADENLDRPIVEHLRSQGHEVLYVAEMEPGIDDEVVLGRANAKRALLITSDKDFGELVFRLNRIHAGVILLRLHGYTPTMKAEALERVLAKHGEEMQNAFTVIAAKTVRIRHRLL